MGVWAPGNGLGAEGALALANPLGKLVHVASLNMSSTWHGCVSCVCMHAMPCPSVCGGCGRVKLCG